MTASDQRNASADDRERRLGRVAAAACAVVVVLSFGAILVATSGSTVDRTPKTAPDRAEQLMDLHKGATEQGYALIMKSVAMLVLVGVSLFLWDVVRRRDPSVPRWVFWAGIIGAPFVAATTAAVFLVLRDIADTFVTAGPHTVARADHLVKSSGTLSAVRITELASHALFGAWCAGIAWYAMRVGLLTRFLGIWGIGAGAALAISLPFGDALLMGWVASIGLLAYGYWPGEGRPPAWDAGRAIPWTSAAQAATQRPPADGVQ